MSTARPFLRWQSLDLQVSSALPPELDIQLREFWQTRAGATGREVSLTLGPLPPPRDAVTQRVSLLERPLEIRVAADELWLGEQLWARTGPLNAEVRCRPDGASPEVWALMFTELHRAGGWLPLHAAVVASGSRAVAITGVSGAGKSTAALRLSAAGMQVIAEDRAFWHPASGEIRGLDTHLRVYDDSLARFAPERLPGAVAWERDGHGKLRIPLQTGSPQATRLVQLLLLRPAELDLLTPPERVRVLWETTGVPLTFTARQQVQRGVAQLLRLLSPHPLTREQVEPAVRGLLAFTSPAES
ncbi:hypothetical protein [Deinococcus alpinitundrae]|uniref:hypothetical protein n=1 Tax=Deinococcus alpinitundrae TaxID=468913 RepID=UPI00137B38C7|nr:hypothetical protein [Deinococcus alpinitundrae]